MLDECGLETGLLLDEMEGVGELCEMEGRWEKKYGNLVMWY